MNNLIASVCKDRLIPEHPELLDITGFFLETQMIRLADFIAEIILNKYIYLKRYLINNSDKIVFDTVLETIFPKDWLKYVPDKNYYLCFKHMITQLYPQYIIHEEIQKKIAIVVEFLCYEILENAVLHKNCKYLCDLTTTDIIHSNKKDNYINTILTQNNIIITGCRLKTNVRHINIMGIELSNKSNKLIRIYIEYLITKILSNIKNKKITRSDISLIIC